MFVESFKMNCFYRKYFDKYFTDTKCKLQYEVCAKDWPFQLFVNLLLVSLLPPGAIWTYFQCHLGLHQLIWDVHQLSVKESVFFPFICTTSARMHFWHICTWKTINPDPYMYMMFDLWPFSYGMLTWWAFFKVF